MPLIPDEARELLQLQGRLSAEAVRNGGGRVDWHPLLWLRTRDAEQSWLVAEMLEDGDTLVVLDLGGSFLAHRSMSLAALEGGWMGHEVECDPEFVATHRLSAYASGAVEDLHLRAVDLGRLFTDAEIAELRRNSRQQARARRNFTMLDFPPVAKLVDRAGGMSWLLTELDGDRDTLFGLHDPGTGAVSLDTFSVYALSRGRGGGNDIAREGGFKPAGPLSDYVEAGMVV